MFISSSSVFPIVLIAPCLLLVATKTLRIPESIILYPRLLVVSLLVVAPSLNYSGLDLASKDTLDIAILLR